MRTPDMFAATRAVPEASAERHYRLAMRAARQIRRARRRDRAARLVCHHLRCMLDQDRSSA